MKLDGHQSDPNFRDPRHCLVFWARPTQMIKKLVEVVQQKLKDAVPGSVPPARVVSSTRDDLRQLVLILLQASGSCLYRIFT